MKKIISLMLMLILFFPIISFATDEWTKKDTAYQTAFLVLTAMDWQQTKEITRNPNYYEKNPILGHNPKQNKIDAYFLSCAFMHTTIAYYLPEKYRRVWQYLFIGIETGYVAHNYNAGVRINF